MQTHELDHGDLVLTWTWTERQELLGQIEAVQRNLELSFEKHFGKPKATNGMTRREGPGQD